MQIISKYLTLLILAISASYAHSQTMEDDLQAVLQKLDEGESVEHMTIQLSDINFATGTANLEPSAKAYLNKVAKLLKLATNINLLIKGHADNTGSAVVNERLSTDRAKAVMNYLIQQNISNDRLDAKGFGSNVPLADNQTQEGRAKNRRVELEILKKETVKTVQDVIELRSGEKIGVRVSRYDKEQITYRQFTDGTEQQMSTRQVEKIVFADGREVYFNTTDSPLVTKVESNSGFIFRPFAESASFHRGQFIVGAGLGVDNNIGIRYKDNKISLPPVWVVMELPLKHNLGIGVSGGMMRWSPKSDEHVSYTYFSVSSRLAYHLNLVKEVDLYGGVAVTGRFATLESEQQSGEPVTLRNHQLGAGLFAGLRYYFNNFLGVYGEYGNDNVACARLGLAFRFGR